MARRAALESDFKVKVGCAVYHKGKLLTMGWSTNKTHPLQFEYNKVRDFDRSGKCCIDKAHAEMMALARLKKMNVKMSDVTFYVARVCKSRPYAIARPCRACQAALIEAGVRDIRYTTDYGYAREWIELNKTG
jgi:deoxycytidylate deaminase